MTDVRIRPMSDEEMEAAIERGRAVEPFLTRITGVEYSPKSDTLTFNFNNVPPLSIPRRSLQWVREATQEQLARFELVGRGTAISWPELDADFSAEGLLEGHWGTPSWMKQLEREHAQPISA